MRNAMRTDILGKSFCRDWIYLLLFITVWMLMLLVEIYCSLAILLYCLFCVSPIWCFFFVLLYNNTYIRHNQYSIFVLPSLQCYFQFDFSYYFFSLIFRYCCWVFISLRLHCALLRSYIHVMIFKWCYGIYWFVTCEKLQWKSHF